MGDILAFDLGTNAGVARGVAGAPASEITFRTWTMPSGGGERVGPFAAFFMRLLKAELETGEIDCVMYEKPFLAQQAQVATVLRHYGEAFVIDGFCAARGIPVGSEPPASLKKQFTTNGKAKKEEMILTAHRRGFRVADEHQADAAAAWLAAVAVRAPECLHHYDADFAAFMGKA